MTKSSRRVRSAAAAVAFLLAGDAFAQGTFLPEMGLGYGQGTHIVSTQNTWLLNAAFGYHLDNGLGARVMFLGDLDPFRGLYASDRSFDDFVGVQATAYIPVAPKLNLMGGLGIGRTSLNIGGESAGAERVTDGVVSAGLQWKIVRHYAMEVHVDYLTKTGTSNIVLLAQVPF